MFDLPTRLLVAYGLIALMLFGAMAVVLWRARNSQPRRDLRDRARQARFYKVRDEARAADQSAAER